jgi:ADP-ribosylglycohydrolase
VRGLLLGTALGDALGLPREGLSPGRGAALYGDEYLRHRLLFGRGMVSDDTEHAAMVAQALLASGGDPERFARSFAWRLRGWSLALPVSLGWGTARALFKLWLGFPPGSSGVRSAGNGPSMRAALFGACFAHDEAHLRRLVRASTRITHDDDLAEEAALAVALAAARATRSGPALGEPAALLDELAASLRNAPLRRALAIASDLARGGKSGRDLALALGLERGVTGYSLHTVPVALFCWARHGGAFGPSVAEALSLGGDTDTVGAIVGALAGATRGASALPRGPLEGLFEWPRGAAWLSALADRVAARFPPEGPREVGPGPLGWFWPGVVLRNLFFLVVVLAHGFRRLAPPYAARRAAPDRRGAAKASRRSTSSSAGSR